jgi:hypothetical protein
MKVRLYLYHILLSVGLRYANQHEKEFINNEKLFHWSMVVTFDPCDSEYKNAKVMKIRNIQKSSSVAAIYKPLLNDIYMWIQCNANVYLITRSYPALALIYSHCFKYMWHVKEYMYFQSQNARVLYKYYMYMVPNLNIFEFLFIILNKTPLKLVSIIEQI